MAPAASMASLTAAPLWLERFVHDDDIARREFGNENAIDIGLESISIDRTVEHEGGAWPCRAQTRHECRRLPMAERHGRAQPFSIETTAAHAVHIGRGPGLVDEDEVGRIEVGLSLEPGFARRECLNFCVRGVLSFTR